MSITEFKKLISHGELRRFRYNPTPEESARGLTPIEFEAKEGFFDVQMRLTGKKKFTTHLYGQNGDIACITPDYISHLELLP